MSLDPSRQYEFVGENGVQNGVRMLKISRNYAKRTRSVSRHTPARARHTQAHASSNLVRANPVGPTWVWLSVRYMVRNSLYKRSNSRSLLHIKFRIAAAFFRHTPTKYIYLSYLSGREVSGGARECSGHVASRRNEFSYVR